MARVAHGFAAVDDQTTIETLGLSSLERVELLMAIEERFQVTLDEAAFAAARTVGDLRALIAADRPAISRRRIPHADRRRARPARARRPTGGPPSTRAGRGGRVSPVEPRVRGRAPCDASACRPGCCRCCACSSGCGSKGVEHLQGLEGPVVFAANHQSHLDAPTILAALPPRWRYRVAIAMAKEFFKAHFFPEQFGRRAWLTSSLNYYLAALFFNAFPLPQREAGTRETLRYIGELASEGYSMLIFPEGRRTDARRDRRRSGRASA